MLIGYARVSTRDQDTSLQRSALTAAGVDRIFTETAGGADRDRPQFKAALDYCRPGDTLVVWKIDRLARSLLQLTATFADLKSRGIGFSSLTERIDTTTPGGELVFNIMGAIAQFEKDLIIERTRSGLAEAAAQGRRGGRPKKLTPALLARATELMANPTLKMADIAAVVGVTRETLHRAFPEGRRAYLKTYPRD
jgi:DNA invertase Pin-like site-specific DNA recombinase